MRAIVNSPICPLMTQPRCDCELADEALFGMVLEVLEQCKLWNKDILCGVTDIKIAPEEIEGIKVRNIEELWAGRKEALTIVCAKRDTEAYAQMWDNLQKQGISHIAAADELFVEDWWQL